MTVIRGASDLCNKIIKTQAEFLGEISSGRSIGIFSASWCGPCKEDMKELAKLRDTYGAKGLAIVGVNLDTQRSELDDHLRTTPLPWPQLFEPGGLDSPLATELGVLTLPTMLLIDKQGRVANRGIHVSQLETELKKRLK